MPNTHGPSPMETTPKPRAGEHTKGPWRIEAHPIETGVGLYSDSWGFLGFLSGGSPGEANARRIVACVNACEGIPTASLELGDTKQWIREEIALRAERDLLRERERELVEALKAVVEWVVLNKPRTYPSGDWGAYPPDCIGQASAALAKAST